MDAIIPNIVMRRAEIRGEAMLLALIPVSTPVEYMVLMYGVTRMAYIALALALNDAIHLLPHSLY